jgi:hydrogenase-1 operon protein HyaF
MSGAPCLGERPTGMAYSVLAEVGRLLEALSENGRNGAIDLRSLPLTDADRAQLKELLGPGEVTAELDVAGRSTVRETAFASVWWICHRGAGDKVASEEIAICPVPSILVSHRADIAAAAQRIAQTLEESTPGQAEAF